MTAEKTGSRNDRPLIAITCSSRPGLPWGEYGRPQRLDYIVNGYTRGVELAGGLPVGLLLVEDPATIQGIIGRADGLILSGGADLSPSLYGQEPRPGLGETNGPLDRMELAALKAAEERGLPVLGVCRGMQLLAAAFGGGLYQDLNRERPDSLEHVQNADKAEFSHQVTIARPSRLAEIIGRDRLWVNSKHHQAIKEPPSGFEITAQADDGVIEAMERPGQRFMVGVQWHPEGTCHHDEPSLNLFKALVAAASKAR